MPTRRNNAPTAGESTTDLQALGFDLPEGHVLVQNVSKEVELPLENRRVIPTGGLWHMHADELAGHEAAAGHQQWQRYAPETALPVPQGPPEFLTDDPMAEEAN